MKLRIEKGKDVDILRIAGKIISGEDAQRLASQIYALADEGRKPILLDLENVVSVSSTGLAALISGYFSALRSGHAAALFGLRESLKPRLLEVTGLSKVIESFDSKSEAVAFLKESRRDAGA